MMRLRTPAIAILIASLAPSPAWTAGPQTCAGAAVAKLLPPEPDRADLLELGRPIGYQIIDLGWRSEEFAPEVRRKLGVSIRSAVLPPSRETVERSREAMRQVARFYADKGLVTPERAEAIIFKGFDELKDNSLHVVGLRGGPGLIGAEVVGPWREGAPIAAEDIAAHGRVTYRTRWGKRVRLPMERDLVPEELNAAGEVPELSDGIAVEFTRAILDARVPDVDRMIYYSNFFGQLEREVPGVPAGKLRAVATSHNDRLTEYWSTWGFKPLPGKRRLIDGGEATILEATPESLREALESRIREESRKYLELREKVANAPVRLPPVPDGTLLWKDREALAHRDPLLQIVVQRDPEGHPRLHAELRDGDQRLVSSTPVLASYEVLDRPFRFRTGFSIAPLPGPRSEVKVVRVRFSGKFPEGTSVPTRLGRIRYRDIEVTTHFAEFDGTLRWERRFGEKPVWVGVTHPASYFTPTLEASSHVSRHLFERLNSVARPSREAVWMPLNSRPVFKSTFDYPAFPALDFFKQHPDVVAGDGSRVEIVHSDGLRPDFLHSTEDGSPAGFGERNRVFLEERPSGNMDGLAIIRRTSQVFDAQGDWRERFRELGIQPRR